MEDRAPQPEPLVGVEDAHAIANGNHGDPFAVLGRHEQDGTSYVAAFDPGAARLWAVVDGEAHELARQHHGIGLFAGEVPAGSYHLKGEGEGGTTWTMQDAYRFGPVIGEQDEYYIGEGTHKRLWHVLGAHVIEHEDAEGVHFAVWAPNARRVSVVGDFNQWDGRRHVMRRRGATGAWETFVPGLGEPARYMYEIVGHDGRTVPRKADPVGFGAEHPPAQASLVRDIAGYGWDDDPWMETRAQRHDRSAPISIYEVHLGSWRRDWSQNGRPLSYVEAARDLVDYVHDMGFTHIQLMPINEHPFTGSWGYQPVGLYAPSVRHGPPHEFRDLIEAAHRKGLGILMDWVPGHFPTDAHGLGRFDGTALYEHADPRLGFHPDWNTYIYNFGRTEVWNYLVSNARYWLEEYHIDGLRVDAVASMLYRDYSRRDGEWIPNEDGGNENWEAVRLLQRMNEAAYESMPGIMTVAEESTSWPGVSRPVHDGGLGFGYKWNMGWMNDTLEYIKEEPVHRKYHHSKMTWGIHYAFSENFILPISHDEVVHGKGSMIGKMPGNEWEKFANLRTYWAFMFGHPGKKLMFMGCEFAQPAEWNHDAELDWDAAERPAHAGMRRLVRDLNRVYREQPALHAKDCEPDGFQWIEADDAERSVFAWLRRGGPGDAEAVVVSNFTPVERRDYRLGLPHSGRWREAINTDAEVYGGGNRGNLGGIEAGGEGSHGQAASATVTLPPLSTLILVQDR